MEWMRKPAGADTLRENYDLDAASIKTTKLA